MELYKSRRLWLGTAKKGLLLHAALRAGRKSMLTIPHVKLELGEGCLPTFSNGSNRRNMAPVPNCHYCWCLESVWGALRTMTSVADYSMQVPRILFWTFWKLPPLHSIPLTPELAGNAMNPHQGWPDNPPQKTHPEVEGA